MKKRVGGESSESKDGERRRRRRCEVSPGWGRGGGRGRCGGGEGKKADEIRDVGVSFRGGIKSKNRCFWSVM